MFLARGVLAPGGRAVFSIFIFCCASSSSRNGEAIRHHRHRRRSQVGRPRKDRRHAVQSPRGPVVRRRPPFLHLTSAHNSSFALLFQRIVHLYRETYRAWAGELPPLEGFAGFVITGRRAPILLSIGCSTTCRLSFRLRFRSHHDAHDESQEWINNLAAFLKARAAVPLPSRTTHQLPSLTPGRMP